MKADLVEYLCAMSNHDSKNIEEIIAKKYRKFISFFELIRERSEDINHLKYNLSDGDTLNVTITMRCNVKDDVNEEIRSNLEAIGYGVETSISKKKISIILTYKEEKK